MMETVRLSSCHLTSHQSMALFTRIASGDKIKTRFLDITANDLSDVHVNCLAKAASKLETLRLSCCRLKPYQSTALLTRLAASSEQIKTKSLDIRINDLSSRPSRSWTRLVSNTQSSRNPKWLQFWRNLWSKAPSGLRLARSIICPVLTGFSPLYQQNFSDGLWVSTCQKNSPQFRSAPLSAGLQRETPARKSFSSAISPPFQRRAGLSADQAKAIFNTLTTSTCLRQMSFLERFTTNLTDLSAVNPRVLSEVLVKLYRLRLYRTLLTSEQLRFYSL